METPVSEKIPNLDAFTDSVMRRIDRKVLASFTREQLRAIHEGISASRPLSKHPIDVRGIIPLFFTQYYFVLLMGKDRRLATRRIENIRREKSALAGGALFLFFGMSPLILFGLLLLYFMKSAMGIDLFPDKHLWDILRDMINA